MIGSTEVQSWWEDSQELWVGFCRCAMVRRVEVAVFVSEGTSETEGEDEHAYGLM